MPLVRGIFIDRQVPSILAGVSTINALVVGNGSYILRAYGHDLHSLTVVTLFYPGLKDTLCKRLTPGGSDTSQEMLNDTIVSLTSIKNEIVFDLAANEICVISVNDTSGVT